MWLLSIEGSYHVVLCILIITGGRYIWGFVGASYRVILAEHLGSCQSLLQPLSAE